MKRVLALILAMLSMVSTALAGDWLYIANPNPNDRLHLRAEPYDGAKSLGKYYNGAPIERTGYFNSLFRKHICFRINFNIQLCKCYTSSLYRAWHQADYEQCRADC